LDVNFTIRSSTLDDLPAIQQRYAEATALQASKDMTQWPVIEEETILSEVKEGRQWKLLVKGEMACVWVVAYEDPLIWGERGRPCGLPSSHCHRTCSPWTRLGGPHRRLGERAVHS